MRPFTLLLAVSLFPISSILTISLMTIGGCTATTSDSPIEFEDSEPSDTISSALVSPLVGSYEFRGNAKAFGDIEWLDLRENGTYEAMVESALVNPLQRCIRAPCTALEFGAWHALRQSGPVAEKLVLVPKQPTEPHETRSYSVEVSNGTLALSRSVLVRNPSGCLSRYTIANTLSRLDPKPL
jgi:hypothetical protein